jgi:hypothetical protein
LSEVREIYSVDNNLLQSRGNPATMTPEQPIVDGEVDWAHVERILSYLVPVLNLARKEQGKRPVIVPKG